MGIIPFELALTCYLVAVIIGIVELIRGTKTGAILMLTASALGFVNHTISIAYRYVAAGHLPITSPHEAASFFAWSILFLFFIIEFRYRVGLLGSFIMPVVFLIMLASSLLSRDVQPLSPTLQSYWLGIHTLFAFLGNAAFALACVTGMMYLVQEHYLKSKHLGELFQRLPDIQTLDYINYRLISVGFPLLTLAIVTGAMWAQSAWGRYWGWDPRETWSLVTWLIYALILHSRLVAGWRGKRAAILSIVGFVTILIAFFGIKFLSKGIHVFQ
jgi:cytochrome c-type biogenesis protein CcsB